MSIERKQKTAKIMVGLFKYLCLLVSEYKDHIISKNVKSKSQVNKTLTVNILVAIDKIKVNDIFEESSSRQRRDPIHSQNQLM